MMKSTITSAAWSIGFVVFLVFIVYAVIFGGEQTGTVRTDDCRTKVQIESVHADDVVSQVHVPKNRTVPARVVCVRHHRG